MTRSASMLAALGLLAGTFMIPATSPAATLSPPVSMESGNANIQLAHTTVTKTTVVKRKKGQVVRRTSTKWVYDSGRHGPRYRKRTGGYRYYYGGYYYSKPWWAVNVGVPGVNVCVGC